MARRRKKRKQKQKAIRAQQKANRPSARLAEAHALAAQGDLAHALPLAQAARFQAKDATTIERASALVAEILFRVAAESVTVQERLRLLAEGEGYAPQDQRFPYHRGLALLALQQPDDALMAFNRAYEIAPAAPQIGALIAYAQFQLDPTSIPAETPQNLTATLEMLSMAGRDQLAKEAISAETVAALPGNDPVLWQSLLTMASDPKSSRFSGLGEATDANGSLLVGALLKYFAGVAALRRTDHETAVAAWQTAQLAGLETPNFRRSRLYVLRQNAEQLAAQEAWTEIVHLLDRDPLTQSDKALKELLGYGNFHLGTIEAEAQRWDTAVSYWRRAAEQIPSRHLSQNLALAEEMNEEWHAAAEAWRNTIRRRPRKIDHPDYLDEQQVALIWRRTSECYGRASIYDEQITCLSKAIDYAPDNLAWRMQLVQAYLEDERYDAAENELDRILDVDSQHMPALLELATLYDGRWDRDALSIWRRAVAADERNETARDGLARALLEHAQGSMPSFFASLIGDRGQGSIKKLEKAIGELPDHPLLLLELGRELDAQGKTAMARERLYQAGRAAGRSPSNNIGLLGDIMHELLHVDGDKHVPELMDVLRSVPSLRATFWYEQGDQVLDCDLKAVWAERFWQEAIELAKRRPKPDSPALILFLIIGCIDINDLCYVTWADNFVESIDDIAPNCGLNEYWASLEARDADDPDKALRLLRRAIRKARSAGEMGLLENLERMEGLVTGSFRSPLDSIFGGLDPEDIAAMLDDFGDMPDDLSDIFK